MAKKRAAERLVRLVRPPDTDGVGIFCLSKGAKQTLYVFREVPCEIGGRGFAVHRLGLGPLYFVRVGKPGDRSCECMGFLAHNQCKHIQAHGALVEHGAI
jgi:hypothetical protein